jgi:hypothetical protein
MYIMELVEEILDTLRNMEDAFDVIGNLDAEAVVKRMKVADIIPIPEGATNGDVVKAPFLNYCDDKKGIIEDDDGEECEVHYLHIWGSRAINRYDENWWNTPYKTENEVDNGINR